MKTVKLEVEDKQVEMSVPEGAIVTTAIVMIEYQYIDEDGELEKGFSWILKGWDEDGI